MLFQGKTHIWQKDKKHTVSAIVSTAALFFFLASTLYAQQEDAGKKTAPSPPPPIKILDFSAPPAASSTKKTTVKSIRPVQLDNLDSLLPQGTLIGATLETAVQSDLPGSVRAVVNADVFSFTGERLLIPKGSRLIGAYKSGITTGQTRLFIIWERLILPEGISIALQAPGTDDLGRSGVSGFYDPHFFRRFGASMLLTLIDGAIRLGTASLNDKGSSTIVTESSNSFNQQAALALQNSINIPPTIHIDQGRRIRVFVNEDIDFSAF